MPHTVDLNCDLGELEGDEGLALDASMISFVSSVNAACGQHAGDARRMAQVARLCRIHSVAFGAHPGYADREHFGRRVIALDEAQLRILVLSQLELAVQVADDEGIRLAHVKPHGALYNLAASDEATAQVIVETIGAFDRTLLLFALSGSVLNTVARDQGLRVVSEAFADRAYDSKAQLVSRTREGAVLHDPTLIARRAVSMVKTQSVESIEGKTLAVKIDSLCMHGDTPNAQGIAARICKELISAGITIEGPRPR
jgi:UPF0271 protein